MSKKTVENVIENPTVNWIFSEQEKKIILFLVNKGKTEQARNDKFDIIDFDSFFNLFSDEEKAVIEKYMAIKPEEVGCRLPYLGLEEVPDDLVAIPDQEITVNGKKQTLPYKYLPKQTYDAYLEMRKEIKEQTGMDLLISHGYRSSARQVFYFFDSLVRRSNFDFQRAVKRIFFPAYSEHVFPMRQAIDFVTADGKKGDRFEKTAEYQWLKEHADTFNFVESYPQDNQFGVMHEPWHWSHRPQRVSE